MSRQIVLDTETTGLSHIDGDRLIELGCVELVNRKLTGNNLHLYFNVGRDSHPDALRVHGITTEFLADKPRFEEKIDEIWEYLQGAELIIHNAPFDVGFLNSELKLAKRPLLKQCVGNIIDTLVMAKEMYPGKRNSLDSLCDRLGVDNTSRTLHGALLDAELLAEVYLELTGGRQAGLDLTVSVQAASTGDVGGRVVLRPRPVPLPSRLSAAEAEAHATFIAAIGEKALWNTYLDNGERAETA